MKRRSRRMRRFRQHVWVNPDDKRPPMVRLLQDCDNKSTGMVEVEYAQQFSTLAKAEQLGYVDDHQRITPAGRAWLAAWSKDKCT